MQQDGCLVAKNCHRLGSIVCDIAAAICWRDVNTPKLKGVISVATTRIAIISILSTEKRISLAPSDKHTSFSLYKYQKPIINPLRRHRIQWGICRRTCTHSKTTLHSLARLKFANNLANSILSHALRYVCNVTISHIYTQHYLTCQQQISEFHSKYCCRYDYATTTFTDDYVYHDMNIFHQWRKYRSTLSPFQYSIPRRFIYNIMCVCIHTIHSCLTFVAVTTFL